MNEFNKVLDKVRQDHPDLFAPGALENPTEDELILDVEDFDVPDRKEIKQEQQIYRPNLEFQEDDGENLWDLDDEEADFERDTPHAREEQREFEGRTRRVALELLAVYRPFHLYPPGAWGVHYFERPMARFTDRLHLECRRHRLRYSWGQLLKIATYAVARHEFVHYLVELDALELELKLGSQFYLPYWNNVYKREYAGARCLEETVANVWSWDNAVLKERTTLQRLYNSALSRIPAPAYANGASKDRETVRPIEDMLAAQVYKCSPSPKATPPVWGSIPRPYVQPWTRYENVSFTMNRSAGGILGGILGARPVRKTIRIYHR